MLVMIAGGMFLYLAIRKDIYKQIDNNLITEKDIIKGQIEQTEMIPDFSASLGRQIDVEFLEFPTHQAQVIKDTIIHDDKSGDNLPYRYIFYTGNTPKKIGYIISILHPLSEKLDLLEAISIYTSFLFLSLLIISIFLNYLISRRLWSPFYRSVEVANNFDVLSDKPLDFPDTDILEFRQLNRVFLRMTRKMRADYLNLKEFNENAAHEIQTPLAIIRSKTELLMQNRYLNKDSLNLIKSINEAITRLFKLNQGLLIISKIDNQYYHDNKQISLREVIEKSLDNYREIMQLKKIRVEMEATDNAVVEMNEVLADILISNLLSNAVRYNIDNGFIYCRVDGQYVTISNSGLPLNADPESLFHRFQRNTDNPQSVGLGLSIVRKITDNYKMQISYSWTGNIHEIKLNYSGNLQS